MHSFGLVIQYTVGVEGYCILRVRYAFFWACYTVYWWCLLYILLVWPRAVAVSFCV